MVQVANTFRGILDGTLSVAETLGRLEKLRSRRRFRTASITASPAMAKPFWRMRRLTEVQITAV